MIGEVAEIVGSLANDVAAKSGESLAAQNTAVSKDVAAIELMSRNASNVWPLWGNWMFSFWSALFPTKSVPISNIGR
jgi:hypothetical protein